MANRSLAVFCPSNTCATSFYRGIGPLGALRRSYTTDNLNLVFMNEINWANLKLIDYGFMQRPYTDNHVLIAQLMKRQRIPIWMDYDDLLLDIPEDNPNFKGYNAPGIKTNIEKLLGLADIVSVSTEELGQQLYGFSNKIVVIRNAFDDVFLPQRTSDQSRQNLILWRGSKTHDADLDTMQNAAIDLCKKYDNWNWLFLGSKPWFVNLMPKNRTIVIEDHLDIFEYHDLLANMRPAVMIVPLVESIFNKSKSDCAFLEGTFAGAVVVAPYFQSEFSADHCFKYPTSTNSSNPDCGLTFVLDQVLQTDPLLLLAKQEKAWQDIKRSRLLSTANKTRSAIIDHLKELRND